MPSNKIKGTRIIPKQKAHSERDLAAINEAYARLSRRLGVLEQIQHLFLSPEAIEANVEKVLVILMEALNVSSGSILLADEEKEELYFASAKGPKSEAVLHYRLKPGVGIAGAVVTTHETIAVSDASKDPRFAKEIADAIGFFAHSLLAVPILYKGGVFGVMELINKIHSCEFTQSEIQLSEEAARLLGMLIAIGSRLR